MIIKKVRVNGFNKIYDGYATSYANEAYRAKRQAFGNQLFDFLKHASISIDLSDLSTIELFYMKKFASSIIYIDKEYENFVEKDMEDIHQKVSGLLELHNQMLNDEDINKEKSLIDYILPIGCFKHRVIAVFKGSAITSVCGLMLDTLFMDEGKISEAYMGDLEIAKRISGLFYNKFYQYMSEKMTEIDLVTEYMLNKKFYEFNDNICNLSDVSSPIGELQFFGNDSQTLNKQLTNYKKAMATCPYYLPYETYLTFSMKTTFQLFFRIYMYTNYVVDHKNLKIVFTNDEVNLDNDILNKYSSRISSCVNYIASFKKGLAEEQKINLNKFNYIFNGTEIDYTIQIPMNEISSFIETFEYYSNDRELEIVKENMKSIYATVESLIS